MIYREFTIKENKDKKWKVFDAPGYYDSLKEAKDGVDLIHDKARIALEKNVRDLLAERRKATKY